MTATNHVMTGAVIALAVKQPALAIPLAFLSHFVLDMMPHFGMYENDIIRRNDSRVFRTILSVDVLLMLVLFVAIPYLAADTLAWGIVFAGMLAAILPDTIWIYRFRQELKTRKPQPSGWFVHFHQKIQWFEHPSGLIVEFIWLSALIVIFARLSS